MSLELIIGLGIVSFCLLYLASQLDKDHTLLRLLLVFAVFSLFVLIPKAIIDSPAECAFITVNETQTTDDGNNTITAYEYEEVCSEVTTTTHHTFYNAVLWLWRLWPIYILVYFVYVIWLKTILKGMGIVKDDGDTGKHRGRFR